MFKPDALFKRLARKFNACAYVYKDGIHLWEKRTVRSGIYTTEISVNHFWPCEIVLRSHGYKPYHQGIVCKRLVVHSPALLIGGLERAEVAYGNSSEASNKAGVLVTTIEFTQPSGCVFTATDTSLFSGSVHAQPNIFANYSSNGLPDSILTAIKHCKDNLENVEIHGSLPEQESTNGN